MSMLPTTAALLACLAAALMTGTVYGFPFGAPNFVCRAMRPSHTNATQPARTLPVNIAFFPDRAMPGDVIDVHVWVKDPRDRFQGMLVTARSPMALDTPETGFINTNTTHFKLLNCTGSSGKTNTGLTHKGRLSTDRASFKWRVPSDAFLGSTYLLRFTIVRTFKIYWVGMNTTFTVGRPRAQPEVTRPTSAPSTLPGQRSASRMTSPVTGSGSGISTSQAANQQPAELLPEGRSHTGQSPLSGQQSGSSQQNGQQSGSSQQNGQQSGSSQQNGQQSGSSQQNGQQSGSPQISGGQSAAAAPRLNGQAGPAESATNVRPNVPTTGQSSPGNAVGSRQSGRAPGVTAGTAGTRFPPRQRPPQASPLGLQSTGAPTSGSSPQGTPARSRGAGLGSSTVEVARPAPQRNQVARVPDPPAQRTNTLPGGQRRRDRVSGSAGASGAAGRTSGAASGSSAGGMDAWLAGWFG